MNFKNKLFGAAVAFCNFAIAQTSAPTAVFYPQMYANQSVTTSEKISSDFSAKQRLDQVIDRMMTDPVLRNADWGYVVYNPKTKKIISSFNENAAFIPASTTKLLTTDAAMALLGPKFSWTTQLEYSGEIDEQGVLNGNLYIVGSGDPSLGTGKAGASTYGSVASDFKYAIQERGIRRVNGDIIMQTAVYKDSKLSTLPENIVWRELPKYYLPAGSTKDVNPQSERLVATKALGQSKQRYFYVSPYTGKMAFTDEYSGGSLSTNIAQPPAYLGNSLKTSLVKSGIPVSGAVSVKIIDASPEPRKIITAYRSPLLADIVYDTNQRSDNALAEALMRMVGFQKYGDHTSESGRAAVDKHLQEVNFDKNGFNYADGSGLSRSNYVTPMAQVKFLTEIMEKPYYQDFYASLPIGGQTGTLKSWFKDYNNGRIFAKTGTLNRVKALAGYIQTYQNETLVFSMLINNYSGSVDQLKIRMQQLLEPATEL